MARQRNPEPPQPSLFEGLAEEEIGGLQAALAAEDEIDMVTFVVAYSLDPVNQRVELVLGRPRLNFGGGQTWEWRQDLLDTAPADRGRRIDEVPVPTGPNTVPDAPVRLRRPAEERGNGRGSGER